MRPKKKTKEEKRRHASYIRRGRPARTELCAFRLTAVEKELLAAAADANKMTVADLVLMSAIASGVDIETRWTGPFPPAVKRLLRAYQALETERIGPEAPILEKVVAMAREASLGSRSTRSRREAS